VLIELATPLWVRGEFERLRSALDELKASPEPRSRAYAILHEVELWQAVEPSLVVTRGEAAIEQAEAILSGLDDERGLALAAQARFEFFWMQSRSIPAHAAILEMREHARRSGDPAFLQHALLRGYGILMFGYVPVAEILRELDEMREAAAESPLIRQAMLLARGYTLGLQGQHEEGLALIAEARAILEQLGNRVMHASQAHVAGPVALRGGDAAAAVQILRESVRALEELGERGFRSTSLAHLAFALHGAGEPEEAEQTALAAEEISAPDDYINFAIGRSARALVLADRGELDDAEQLARSAVEYAFRTDFPTTRGDALATLARVLRFAGRDHDADLALTQAVELYKAKGADACVPWLLELAGSSL
jgi:tetratricopeptide (TPR) repeat protein